MTPERWAQIEALFHRAAECEPELRVGLLDESCRGDLELRREVEALLHSSGSSAGDYLHATVNAAVDSIEFPLAGETVSHYRILEGLAEGGMGFVYRAEDIKLGRQVALKFLPEDSANDAAALGRFEREARAASALEHPNICPIYEFGEHGGRPFIVMQLLEGQTLRELIAVTSPRKPSLGIEKVLDLAIQIANGLAAAHQKGIIHRDIKPANIFVTNQGQAKILDFGLAKLAPVVKTSEHDLATQPDDDPQGTSREDALPATSDLFLSRMGERMGTAAYMSPEQVRGEKLDARTDLFSFGLVLYEMATGQRAFVGDSAPALHDAILQQIPKPAREVIPDLPSKLNRIIDRALEKDRDARYQSAREIIADLRNLWGAREPRLEARRRAIVAGAVAALTIGIAFIWFVGLRPASKPSSPELKSRQLTTNSYENRVTSGAISPDGKYLAYSDTTGMYLKFIETGEIRAVPQPEDIKDRNVGWECVSWLPDGTRFVANLHHSGVDPTQWGSHESSIWMASVLGERLRKLRDSAVAYSISPDGTWISFGTNKGRIGDREIWLMGPSGDKARKLFDTDEESAIGGLTWSGTGKRALYVKTDQSGDTLLSRDLKSGAPTTIFGPSEMQYVKDYFWLTDGRLLYSVAEAELNATCNLWELRLDRGGGEPVGKPTKLTNWSGFCINDLSETSDGKRLAFLKSSPKETSFVADLAAGGTGILRPRHFPLSESSEAALGWMPDSEAIFFRSNRSGHDGIYRQSLDQDIAEPVLIEGYGRNPCVTPDGKSILYLGPTENGAPPATTPQPVMRISISGGPSQRLFTASTYSLMTCAGPPSDLCVIGEPAEDGKKLIMSGLNPVTGRGRELFRFPLFADDKTWYLALSPDGSRVAATRTSAGPIYILSLSGQLLQQVEVKGWSNLLSVIWAADGKGFFVTAGIRNGREILHVDLHGNAHALWEDTGGTSETLSFPSPDGRHLAFNGWATNGNVWLMENF